MRAGNWRHPPPRKRFSDWQLAPSTPSEALFRLATGGIHPFRSTFSVSKCQHPPLGDAFQAGNSQHPPHQTAPIRRIRRLHSYSLTELARPSAYKPQHAQTSWLAIGSAPRYSRTRNIWCSWRRLGEKVGAPRASRLIRCHTVRPRRSVISRSAPRSIKVLVV